MDERRSPSRRKPTPHQATGARRQPTNRRSPQHSPSASRQHTQRASQPRSRQYSQQRPATNRYARAERPVYVGARPPRSRARIPLAIGGLVVLIALIAGIAAGISSCSSQPQADENQDQSLAVADAEAQTTTLTISFAGDCTLGTDANFDQSTSFNARYDAVDDPSWFFANVVDLFNQDDLTVVNMEGTLTESTTRADKTFAFKGPAEYAKILTSGGVETASLANNHSHDYGDASYTDTIEALEAEGLGTFGYDRIDYRDVKGVKVALIGTYELAEGAGIQAEMEENIRTAKEQGAQITIVFFHWGEERETVPNDTQIKLGHAAVDAGADLVVGSHPHVIQGYEKYNGRYIVYSLGNFCFGGNSNPSDKDCMIFQQTFSVTGSDVATDDAINVIPCSISSKSGSNNYQPTPAEGDEKERIAKKIKTSSDAIAERSQELTGSSS